MSESRTVLKNEPEARAELKRELDRTWEAVSSSFSDDSAFSGIDPNELRKMISSIDFLPEEGLGFDRALELTQEKILPHMLRTWSTDYMPHLHSPALLESIASELMISIYNNSMDSWDQSPAATEVELAVIRLLTKLFGYDDEIKRSDQFGLSYLRLGRRLQPGFVLTVEPGIYFIPALIDMWRSKEKFSQYIDYDKVEAYKDFGGIRIEDDVLITEKGCKVLGQPIPKTVAEVEEACAKE